MGEGFAVGSRVSARGLAWDVIEVAPLGAQTLLHLRCAGGDLNGLEWDILHPAEPVEPLRSELRPDAPGPLAAWRLYHQACLLEQVLGPADILVAEPGRVRIEPYQLVPLMRALELPRPRLLLADGVGLGKTIEAGLIACELIARRRAHRILVIAPAGPLLTQWAQELRHRFGLRFTVIADAAALQQQRRRLELGGNPFDAIALCLTSLDFAKQERVLEELERSAWDLAIIDEAHHCVSAGTDREATQRRRLAEVVARRSDGLLLLTATPHDGYDPHFASLIELLDPSLVDGRGGVVGIAYRRHVVRRLKSHIRDPATGEELFRERRVIPVKVEVDGAAFAPVRQFHHALAGLIAPRLQRAAHGREHADALAFVSLLKRSVSSIGACVNTLRVVAERYRQASESEAETLRRERARSLRSYRKRLLRFGVLEQGDESDMADLEADGMAADLHSFGAAETAGLTRAGETAMALDALIRLGEAAEPFDPKLDAIGREVRVIRAGYPHTNILIYTEYADSQSAALRALRSAAGGEVLAISGIDAEPERTRIAERFAEQDGIILISTDSLAEGLNLQQRCCNLIHLDLPYNPNRLEQRNGRIDRYGQQRDPQIRYLYLAGTFEERLLLRLIAKYEKARAQLTFMPDTLGVTADEDAWSAGLVAGFAERQAGLFDDEPSAIRTLDRVAEAANADAYRDLLHEIDRAFDGFDRSAVRHGWLDDRGVHAGATPMEAASAARARGDASLGHIDLPDFVAAAIGAETGSDAAGRGVLRLPADWIAGLDDLPGFDHQHRLLRYTRDRARLRDRQGRSLAYLGRAHPLVRRAISRVQRIADAAWDNRVSVAWTDAGTPPAVLLTFSAELRSAVRIEFQRTIAVLLPVHGDAVEVSESAWWQDLAVAEQPRASQDAWRTRFAHWVPNRQPRAESVANAAMQRDAATVMTDHQSRSEREADDLRDWLGKRAEGICGAFVPQTGDLFGAAVDGPDWQSLSAPLDRLAAFTADASNSPARRREANSAVELCQRRSRERAAHAALSPPVLRLIGMLMLVPSA
ncbi:MAG TPA: helicase-related protein [Acetobacteraceae bacterium]|jgi:superfamily II DNA or RNA helicase